MFREVVLVGKEVVLFSLFLAFTNLGLSKHRLSAGLFNAIRVFKFIADPKGLACGRVDERKERVWGRRRRIVDDVGRTETQENTQARMGRKGSTRRRACVEWHEGHQKGEGGGEAEAKMREEESREKGTRGARGGGGLWGVLMLSPWQARMLSKIGLAAGQLEAKNGKKIEVTKLPPRPKTQNLSTPCASFVERDVAEGR